MSSCSGAPPAPANDPVASAFSGQASAAAFVSRLDSVGRSFLGRPYKLGPLGEGDSLLGEAKPRFRTDSFDCLTYIETVEALARSPQPDSVLPVMDRIRYQGGLVGWGTRLHYTEADWLPEHTRVGRLRLDTLPGSVGEPRTLGRKAFYAKRGHDRSDTTVLLPMLPREVVLKDFARPSAVARIRGLGLVGTIPGLGILHTGFLVERPGQVPVLRHASQAGTVREQPLVEYLASKPRFVGIVVWSYLP